MGRLTNPSGLINVQEDGVAVVAPALRMNFIEPDATLVTDSPTGTARVDVSKYALLAGRSGGQTLIGGTGAAENLILRATNHATDGEIIFYADSGTSEFGRFGASGLSLQTTGSPNIGIDALGGNGAFITFARVGSDDSIRFSTLHSGVSAGLRIIIDRDGQLIPGANDGQSLGISGTAWSDLFLASGAVINFAAADVTLTHSTGLLTASGALKTGAPVGGTAANWKFGTVASVSPTAQNRTIELEVGGTTYYLTAKTTNN